MRLSELLGRRVVDADGHDLGRVHDVRLRGPGFASTEVAMGSPPFRVDGLVVGSGGFADRLGFDRAGVRAPALVRVVAKPLLGPSLFVPWDRVAGLAERRVTITGSGADLEPPTPLSEASS